ncbi:MAG: sigma-70 family RNA polymerase sigma factor [Phycisphaeraceae bacterium]|nr:sigma-70 family RNA polymerase sigma factor [Phycisphaeraceae bacterium]
MGLVDAAIAGDAEALRALWHQHRRWVAAVILAHKPSSVDVDDLLQDVAATVVAKISTVSDAAAFVPWLRTVAINAARLAGRRHVISNNGLRLVRERIEHATGGVSEDTAEASARRDEAAKLMRLALGLAEEYREPLLLRAVQGLSYREIASILDLPETTVETRIARARRMLREQTGALAATPQGRLTDPAGSRI